MGVENILGKFMDSVFVFNRLGRFLISWGSLPNLKYICIDTEPTFCSGLSVSWLSASTASVLASPAQIS